MKTVEVDLIQLTERDLINDAKIMENEAFLHM